MNDLRHGFKILTHDWCSPLQGGPPLCDGVLPVTLPTVALDPSDEECAAGWNYAVDIVTGWRIAGMWPTGYPTRIVAVHASADAIQRKDKRRASSLTLLREATTAETHAAIDSFSEVFGPHAQRMTTEQSAWWRALGRPRRDPAEVEAQLALALSARKLSWNLRRYENAKAARDAWDARDAWAARAAWDAWDARDAWAARAARDAWDAWDAWDARDARAARAARDAWDARDARDAWAARDAWDARDALTIFYACLIGWQDGNADQYTVGIREAYRHGLAIAVPAPDNTLAWAMEEDIR